MKKFYQILLLSLWLLPVNYVLGAEAVTQDLNPRLVMELLTAITPTEKSGDELYFDISVYRANKQAEYLRVPTSPGHWPSKIIDKLNQITLWSEPLKSGEATTLILSLVESDDTLVNPDDLIGSIKVEMKNDKGVLQTNWSQPNRTEELGQKDIQKFELVGGGKYELYLSLKK